MILVSLLIACRPQPVGRFLRSSGRRGAARSLSRTSWSQAPSFVRGGTSARWPWLHNRPRRRQRHPHPWVHAHLAALRRGHPGGRAPVGPVVGASSIGSPRRLRASLHLWFEVRHHRRAVRLVSGCGAHALMVFRPRPGLERDAAGGRDALHAWPQSRASPSPTYPLAAWVQSRRRLTAVDVDHLEIPRG